MTDALRLPGLFACLALTGGVSAIGAQSPTNWTAMAGPTVAMANAPTADGGVLGIGVRLSRRWMFRGRFSSNFDLRGHIGKRAASGDIVCVGPDPCQPVITGQVPWSMSIGPAVQAALITGSTGVFVRGFVGPTLGGLNHLRNQGTEGSFVAAQGSLAIAVQKGRAIVEFEWGQLTRVREMRPTLWSLRLGRTW